MPIAAQSIGSELVTIDLDNIEFFHMTHGLTSRKGASWVEEIVSQIEIIKPGYVFRM